MTRGLSVIVALVRLVMAVVELDMHFSLKDDRLALLKTHGLHGLTARLERGDV